MRKVAIVFCISLFFFSLQSIALVFTMPSVGTKIVGNLQTAVIREDENFSDVAERYDIGYYELYEANPGIDPDHPPKGSMLIIPTQYILPKELTPNLVLLNLAEMRLYYQPSVGNRVYIYPIGIGKEDWETPVGMLKIIQKTVDPKWVVPESIYKYRKSIGDNIPRVTMPGPDNPLGKYRMRLSKPTYLIHGTNDPASVGRRSSGGCIHLYNKDVEVLFHMVAIGTKVLIVNEPYKTTVSNGKVYFEAHMPLLEDRLKSPDYILRALNSLFLKNNNANAGHIIDMNKATTFAKQHLGIPLQL